MAEDAQPSDRLRGPQRSSNRPAAPESSASADRSTPSRRASTRSATSRAAALLASTTSRTGPVCPSKQLPQSRGALGGPGDPERGRGDPGQAEIVGAPGERRHPPPLHPEDAGRPVEGDLVEAIGAGDDRRAAGPEPDQGLGHQVGLPLPRDADQLELGTGGVDQRPEQVEERPERQLPADGRREPQGGVEPRREQEGEAQLGQAAPQGVRLGLDGDPQLGQDLGAARVPRRGAVAVLGDRDAARGDDDRRGGRDVDRVGAVAPRPAGVEQRRGEADILPGRRRARGPPRRRRRPPRPTPP